ncbi:SLBB domain-containing protein [Luminiphilus sp.]|nr:SLBB domain-containing protein [Luminiphilus sp.]
MTMLKTMRGGMFTGFKKQPWFIALVFLVATTTTLGQALPPGVSPAMLSQLKSMSPAQQQALAKQYGIALPTGNTGSGDVVGLASPGAALPSATGMTPADVQAAAPDKTEEVQTRARTRYGRALFNRDVSTFAPTDDAPVPESYRLGVGDQLIVQLFGKENEQLSLQIGRSGDVSFPKLGSITLSGLTFEDARDLIKTRVAQQLIGVEAVVSMGRLRAINVFMAGEVSVPGAYSVSAMTTVTQALFQAGGVTDIGTLRHIQVRRGGGVVATFDTYDLLMRGDVSNDIRLQSGDVVFVPPYKGVMDIEGELKRPMAYELAGGETLADMLAMAGSFTRDAYPAISVLTRQSDALGLPEALTVDLTEPAQRQLAARDGDTLTVPKVGDRVANSVILKGAVTRPGSYGWVAGMRLSDLISDARRDLSRDADLGLGMIIRQKNAVLDIEVLSFDLVSVIASPGSERDLALQELDEVLVFSLVTSDLTDADADATRDALLAPVLAKLRSQARQNEPVGVVSVSGAVRAGGNYPLIKGATVETLIDAAGGLTDSAFLQAAELRRLSDRASGEVVADYRDINLSQGAGLELALASRDHLTVRDIPDWSPTDAITVQGEVKFPGEYRIRKGETLSDVINRAGGFTSEASPESAIFARKAVAALEVERAAEFARDVQANFATRLLTEETTTQSIADVSQIVESLQAVEGTGRLLINLPAAMSGDTNADIELTDGDTVTIPKLSNTVSVIGEVKRAGTHTFQSELSLDDYVDLSAGFTRRADDGGIYIVKANGSVVTMERNLWRFTGNNAALDPGDTIVVPINTQYKESLASWREITQIVYQSMVSIAAVAAL